MCVEFATFKKNIYIWPTRVNLRVRSKRAGKLRGKRRNTQKTQKNAAEKSYAVLTAFFNSKSLESEAAFASTQKTQEHAGNTQVKLRKFTQIYARKNAKNACLAFLYKYFLIRKKRP